MLPSVRQPLRKGDDQLALIYAMVYEGYVLNPLIYMKSILSVAFKNGDLNPGSHPKTQQSSWCRCNT